MGRHKTRKRSSKGSRRKDRDRRRTINKWRERSGIIAYVIDVKSVPCMDCGYPDKAYIERLGKFPHWVMDFDHRPGVNKRGNISAMARDVSVPFEVLKREIAKCDVVCSNCHRHRTYARMTDTPKPA